MLVREIFATNLTVSDRPLRLRLREGMNEIQLSAELTRAAFTFVNSLLFPYTSPLEDLEPFALNERFECGLVLRVSEHDVRIRRGLAHDTVRLQIMDDEGKFRTRNQGAADVQEALARHFGLNDPYRFEVFNLGRFASVEGDVSGGLFDTQGLEESGASWSALGWDDDDDAGDDADDFGLLDRGSAQDATLGEEDVARLHEELERARAIEALDEKLQSVRTELDLALAEVDGFSDSDDELARVRQALEVTGAAGEVSDEDLRVLTNPEKQRNDMGRELTRVRTRHKKLLAKPSRVAPLYLNPAFLGGLGLSAGCTLFAVFGGMRPIALGNVATLGCALFGVLQFLKDRDDVTNRGRKRIQLEYEMTELEEKQAAYEEALNEAQNRLKVESAADIEELASQRGVLQAREAELLSERRELQQDPQYVQSSARRHRLQEQYDALQLERTGLGEIDVSSYQIEQELNALGVSGQAEGPTARSKQRSTFDGFDSRVPTFQNPFPVLQEFAADYGLYAGGSLDPTVAQLWSKMISTLMPVDGAIPELSESGSFSYIPGELDSWTNMTHESRSLAVESFSLALALRVIGRAEDAPLPILFRDAPYAHLQYAAREALRRIYATVSAHVQLVVLDPSIEA